MNCLALLESGNYVINLCRALERNGFVFEVVSTPCQISKGGCGYSLKFPCEYKNIVLDFARKLNYKVLEIYSTNDMITKFTYEKIY